MSPSKQIGWHGKQPSLLFAASLPEACGKCLEVYSIAEGTGLVSFKLCPMQSSDDMHGSNKIKSMGVARPGFSLIVWTISHEA